jgi:hypothetical protein
VRHTTLVIGLLVVSGCALVGDADVPETRDIVEAAGPAPWSGRGVLHAQFFDQGGYPEREEWLDRRTGSVRVAYEDARGDHLVYVVRRHGVLQLSSSGARASSVLRTRDARTASWLIGPWLALRRGAARIVRGARADERPAWVVELRRHPRPHAPSIRPRIAWLDRETFLPVLLVGGPADARQVRMWTPSYRRLRRDAVRRDFFTLPSP